MWTAEMLTELGQGNLKGRDYFKTQTYDDIIKTILRNLDMSVWNLAKLTQNKAQWQAV